MKIQQKKTRQGDIFNLSFHSYLC